MRGNPYLDALSARVFTEYLALQSSIMETYPNKMISEHDEHPLPVVRTWGERIRTWDEAPLPQNLHPVIIIANKIYVSDQFTLKQEYIDALNS